ncbi:MAG: hypothetical protein UR15_C0035G0004 [Parcubacteria group bacterium GW2011_GWA2_31_28]|nr:MAG: hypothetical protein UR15_C0035G0004 [Parcubacteria group bacterium GW2011_GWA2_31_28]
MKLDRIFIGIVFIIFATIFISKEAYTYAILFLLSLLILPKLDVLTDFVFSFKDGIKAKFETPKEKIEEDIKENDQKVTKQNFLKFKNIESQILENQQKKYNAEMKTLVHFMYGQPDKPEFMYTPDGSLQTDDALYFFEIKYVLKPEFAENIIKQTTKYLKTIYDTFSPSMGKDKKLIIKLLLASGQEIDTSKFSVPTGIKLEFIKI